MFSRAVSALAITSIAAVAIPSHAALPSYQLVGAFNLPTSSSSFDILPDGRLITLTGAAIDIQSGVNSSTYSPLGSIPTGLVSSFGATFFRVSPSGAALAIGDNDAGSAAQEVLLLSTAALNTSAPTKPTLIACDNYAAHWASDSTLYVSGIASFGAFATITRIDAANITAPTAQTVVNNIGGFSGGVTTDSTYLYTSNGFDLIPGGGSSDVGEVRAIPLASLGGAPVDFELAGIPVADALSGDSLGFDAFGNLLVGGGDFGSGDYGSAAVIDASAIASALAGGPLAPDSAELRLTPNTPGDFYNIRANPATGELLVTHFGSSTVYRYAIPTPGALTLSTLALISIARRRRDA